MPVVGNRIKVSSSSTGTGNIILGSADAGFQTFADGGILNNDVVRYTIIEGSAFEIATGTYLTSGPTLQRSSSNLLESSTGSLLNLGGSATVFVTLADSDIMQTDGGTFTGDVTFDGATAGRDIVFDRSDNALEFADNAKATFGTGNDLQISHGGIFSNIIDSSNALYLQSAAVRFANAGGTEIFATMDGTDGVKLNFSDSTRFQTSSSGVTVTGNIVVSGTVDGRDVATDGTKLDGIATGADVTPSWVPASDPSYLTAHPTITAASSVDNSGRTYIQDITLDANGHVTGITSATETVTNTDTTYSAGSGLSLSGTTFSANADQRSVITQIGQDTNDYISVGTTNIDFVLDGNVDARIENDGDFHADGNVIAYSTTISDPRLKENIKRVKNGLAKVMQLNGYTFDYKADGVSSAGVMSPEVENVLPSAIKKSKLKLKMGDDNETEYDIVQYDQLTALLIEAIKDLKAEIEELKNAPHK